MKMYKTFELFGISFWMNHADQDVKAGYVPECMSDMRLQLSSPAGQISRFFAMFETNSGFGKLK